MLQPKDISKLIDAPNKFLSDFHARVMIKDAPESICQFFEDNQDSIKSDVMVVRSKEDEAKAAQLRNTSAKHFPY